MGANLLRREAVSESEHYNLQVEIKVEFLWIFVLFEKGSIRKEVTMQGFVTIFFIIFNAALSNKCVRVVFWDIDILIMPESEILV